MSKSEGAERISAERQRQIAEEGYVVEHDNLHIRNELTRAAICYAAPSQIYMVQETSNGFGFIDPWPWAREYDKRNKHDAVRRLEIAGALIAAEIDRLLRIKEIPF